MVCAAEFSDRKIRCFWFGDAAAETERLPCRLILVGDGERFERTKSLAVQLSVRKEPFSGVYTGIGALFLSGGCKCICQQD